MTNTLTLHTLCLHCLYQGTIEAQPGDTPEQIRTRTQLFCDCEGEILFWIPREPRNLTKSLWQTSSDG